MRCLTTASGGCSRAGRFAGGWTLDAAEQVCDADLDTLQSLVDKSLVRSVDGRFTMLESMASMHSPGWVSRPPAKGWSTATRSTTWHWQSVLSPN